LLLSPKWCFSTHLAITGLERTQQDTGLRLQQLYIDDFLCTRAHILTKPSPVAHFVQLEASMLVENVAMAHALHTLVPRTLPATLMYPAGHGGDGIAAAAAAEPANSIRSVATTNDAKLIANAITKASCDRMLGIALVCYVSTWLLPLVDGFQICVDCQAKRTCK
jgi:hypothetical protein